VKMIAAHLLALTAWLGAVGVLWSTETRPESALTASELSEVQTTGEHLGAAWASPKAVWKAAR
jgi:hypothetical protein